MGQEMVSSAVMDERVFCEVKRLCCSTGLEGPELLREVAGRLRRVVPFDAYCACTVDPASSLATHAQSEEMGSEEIAVAWLDQYLDHEKDRFADMARSSRTVRLLSENAGWERSSRYTEILAPGGHAHEMSGVFAHGGGLWGTMELVRGVGSSDFRPREVALLRRIAPHMGAGLKVSVLRRRGPVGRGEADVPGVLNLNHQGRVTGYTGAAQRWLRELGDLGPGWWEGADPLPVAVQMVANALGRALKPENDADLDRVPRLRVRARSGRWLTLYGSLTEPDGSGDIVIVIEPSKPEEVAWLNVAAYSLSPREDEVVRLVVQGFSTREISRSLFISEYTVQTHLSNIFEKVGVRSRAELVKHLFFDDLFPTLFG